MLPLFVQTVLVILGVLCFGYAIKRAVKQKKIDCLLFLLGGGTRWLVGRHDFSEEAARD